MPSIWDLPQQEPQRGPAMDEARRRAVAMLGLLGAGLPTSSELGTSVLYDSGRMDAMAGGPTRGEFRDAQQQKVANVALGLLGAIQPLWHGSPHKFKRFDLSRIGTGEGAQAYGHGAYLAESPGIGSHYANVLKGKGDLYTDKAGKVIDIDSLPLDEQFPLILLRNAGGDYRAAEADLIRWSPQKDIDMMLPKLHELEKNGVGIKPGDAYLYESRLRWPDAAREAADPLGPQHFLDWDKPLSEQGEAISKTLQKLPEFSGRIDPTDDLVTGQHILAELSARRGDQSGAAAYLKSKGIPGIRYLDAGSRGTGQGTHNYVVFDDALIEILKRNGVPIEGLLD